MTDAPAGIGHNLESLPLAERLPLEHADLFAKVAAMAQRATNTKRTLPDGIKGSGDLEVVSNIVKAVRDLSNDVDKTRVATKAPYLDAGREIDRMFNTHIERLGNIVTVFTEIASVYHRRVAAEARRVAEETARKAREEEERRIEAARLAEEEGRLAHKSKHIEAAAEADRVAENAEIKAAQAPKEVVRQRFGSGVVASAQATWKGEIVDFDKLDLAALRPYIKRDALEAAVNSAVRMGLRKIDGVRIFEDVKATFR